MIFIAHAYERLQIVHLGYRVSCLRREERLLEEARRDLLVQFLEPDLDGTDDAREGSLSPHGGRMGARSALTLRHEDFR